MCERRRYVISLFGASFLFAVVNYFHLTRRVTCFDCFFSYGLPFPFFHEGRYAGGRGFELVGAALDFLVVLAFGVTVASVWKWYAHKHQG